MLQRQELQGRLGDPGVVERDEPEVVGRRVQRLRVERGLTQRQLAEPTYTPAYVSTLEAGRVRPSDEALKYLADGQFDVLLSDIGMPTMDGYELMRRTRAQEATLKRNRIAAVAITAYARPEDRQRSLLAGYQMHLAKPIEARELIAGIASLLDLTR